MTIKELKSSTLYCFRCQIKKEEVLKEIASTNYFDEWGCAYVSLGKEMGVEYNLCIDNTIGTNENCSAIYKTDYNKQEDCIETDCNRFIHYEINFDNPEWEKDLESAMCEALIEFFELSK